MVSKSLREKLARTETTSSRETKTVMEPIDLDNINLTELANLVDTYNKGCDSITEKVRRLEERLNLMHVGATEATADTEDGLQVSYKKYSDKPRISCRPNGAGDWKPFSDCSREQRFKAYNEIPKLIDAMKLSLQKRISDLKLGIRSVDTNNNTPID